MPGESNARKSQTIFRVLNEKKESFRSDYHIIFAIDHPFSTIAAVNAIDRKYCSFNNRGGSTFHGEPDSTFIACAFSRRCTVFLQASPSPSFICFPFLLRARTTLTMI